MLQRSKDSQSTVNVTDLFEIIFPHRRIVDFREQGLLFKRALCTFRIVQVCVLCEHVCRCFPYSFPQSLWDIPRTRFVLSTARSQVTGSIALTPSLSFSLKHIQTKTGIILHFFLHSWQCVFQLMLQHAKPLKTKIQDLLSTA